METYHGVDGKIQYYKDVRSPPINVNIQQSQSKINQNLSMDLKT